MPIKYGRCTNPVCALRSRTQEADDSNFVCQACQAELTESPPVTPGKPGNNNKTFLVVGAVVVLAVLGGVVYFWAGKPAFIPEPIPPSDGLSKEQVLPKPDPKITGKKSLEEWLDDYSVDR